MQIDTRETPSWASSAGIQWEGTEPEEEALPEWMNGIGQAESSETLEVAESSIPQDEISEVEDLFPPTIPTQETGLTESPLPDWFEAAGWAVSEGDSTSNPETQELDWRRKIHLFQKRKFPIGCKEWHHPRITRYRRG